MWRLRSSECDHPHLQSLNHCNGRDVWCFDDSAGSDAERARVDALREHFTANRFHRKHSSDQILRLQRLHERSSNGTEQTHFPPSNRDHLFPDSNAPIDDSSVKQSLRGALDFFQGLQADDGHWPGDYGGPMFLLPGLIITLYVTGSLETIVGEPHRREMLRYLANHQNQDGGFGLHIEGGSTMFGTVLSYVTMRILGIGRAERCAVKAREWMLSRGGAIYCTSWGKFWLAVLGVYEWEGVNPMPPELWLLPYMLPIHPGRMWCHCRMVYLPMSYVYGCKGRGRATPLTESLKEELYPGRYERIDWDKARNLCAQEDLYYPHPLVQDALWWALQRAEPYAKHLPLRRWALQHTMEHIHYEDENTRYVCIGPVNKAINMLCCWLEDPHGDAFHKHLPRVQDFLWVAEDGMKMKGYNGSMFWDTSFIVQAIIATGLTDEFSECLRKAHNFVDSAQVQEDCPGDQRKWYRHISKGAWPFSTRDHGWPITDCTAEGVKAALLFWHLPSEKVGKPLDTNRIFDAVNVILSFQNSNGGFATYERTRSFTWLEYLNPAETFGDIMIDYSHVECSSACAQALIAFREEHSMHRRKEIDRAIERAIQYILSIQEDDGSWYGNWGMLFSIKLYCH